MGVLRVPEGEIKAQGRVAGEQGGGNLYNRKRSRSATARTA
jgi:hypothetical protein